MSKKQYISDYHPMPKKPIDETLLDHSCAAEGCIIDEPAYVYCALCNAWYCSFHFAGLHPPPREYWPQWKRYVTEVDEWKWKLLKL